VAPDLEVDGPIVRKGVDGGDGYSGFSVRDPISGDEHATELGSILEDAGIRTVVVTGLAGDVCVKATVIDVAPDAVTVQMVGNVAKIADFMRVVEPFGVRELVQSGQVAIGRGSRSISERTLRPVAVPTPPASAG
jgi:nicotinamidase-related amidase